MNDIKTEIKSFAAKEEAAAKGWVHSHIALLLAFAVGVVCGVIVKWLW